MPRIHDMPTHLNVEDTQLGPLTPSQLVRLAAGLSLACIIWDQLTVLPDPLRAGLAALLALLGVLVACCRPAGVGLDAWVLAALVFSLAPRRFAFGEQAALGNGSSKSQQGYRSYSEKPPQLSGQGLGTVELASGSLIRGERYRGNCVEIERPP